MMSLQVAIVAVLALCGTGNGFQLQRSDAEEYVMVVADEFADRTIQLLNNKFITSGLDPLSIPYFEADVKFNFLFQEHDMHIILTNGLVTGISAMVRGGDCILNYDLRILRVDLDIDVPTLGGVFDFDITALGFNPDGTVTAKMTKNTVKISLIVDMKKTTLSLGDLQVANTGDVDLTFRGLGLLGDAAADVVAEVVTDLFKGKILGLVQDKVVEVISQILTDLGEILPEIPPEENPGSKVLKFKF